MTIACLWYAKRIKSLKYLSNSSDNSIKELKNQSSRNSYIIDQYRKTSTEKIIKIFLYKILNFYSLLEFCIKDYFLMFGCISFPLHSDLNSKTIQTFSATLEFWHEQWGPIGSLSKSILFIFSSGVILRNW